MFSVIEALSSDKKKKNYMCKHCHKDSIVFLQQLLQLAGVGLSYVTPESGSEAIPEVSESPDIYKRVTINLNRGDSLCMKL